MANGKRNNNHNYDGTGSASLRNEGDVVFLEGVLDFDTVVPLLPQLELIIKKLAAPVIDLDGVAYTNSAGVALLLEALRNTPKGKIAFRNIPADMKRVIHLSGLQDIIKQS